mmetsp:Transcript_27496/g.88802  ORF Transcript_27496/g.88802 Transcript_27496/m.88802 type:complete len:357 (+) Transcript_27496:70-1140(+)
MPVRRVTGPHPICGPVARRLPRPTLRTACGLRAPPRRPAPSPLRAGHGRSPMGRRIRGRSVPSLARQSRGAPDQFHGRAPPAAALCLLVDGGGGAVWVARPRGGRANAMRLHATPRDTEHTTRRSRQQGTAHVGRSEGRRVRGWAGVWREGRRRLRDGGSTYRRLFAVAFTTTQCRLVSPDPRAGAHRASPRARAPRHSRKSHCTGARCRGATPRRAWAPRGICPRWFATLPPSRRRRRLYCGRRRRWHSEPPPRCRPDLRRRRACSRARLWHREHRFGQGPVCGGGGDARAARRARGAHAGPAAVPPPHGRRVLGASPRKEIPRCVSGALSGQMCSGGGRGWRLDWWRERRLGQL